MSMSKADILVYAINFELDSTGIPGECNFKITKMVNELADLVDKTHLKEEPAKFMIGQRVICNGVICTVVKPSHRTTKSHRLSGDLWIHNPERACEHHIDEINVRPLPNGQL